MKKFEITQEQIEALLKYLVSKPFAEVAQGVEMLTKLPEIQKDENQKDA